MRIYSHNVTYNYDVSIEEFCYSKNSSILANRVPSLFTMPKQFVNKIVNQTESTFILEWYNRNRKTMTDNLENGVMYTEILCLPKYKDVLSGKAYFPVCEKRS